MSIALVKKTLKFEEAHEVSITLGIHVTLDC